MNELVVADRAAQWHRLKALVLDSVSSPITRRVYNLGLDEFITWFQQESRPTGFTKATVTAWRVALEARKLGPISINVRITAVRKLAVEAADNGLLAPELAGGIARIKGVKTLGVRVGNWLSLSQAQALLNGSTRRDARADIGWWLRLIGGPVSPAPDESARPCRARAMRSQWLLTSAAIPARWLASRTIRVTRERSSGCPERGANTGRVWSLCPDFRA